MTRLPSLLLLTDRAACAARGRSLTDTVGLALQAGGTVAVLLREKDLDRDARRALARELQGVMEPAGSPLLVASDVTLAGEVGAGVHLAGGDPHPSGDRPRCAGRSCHSGADVALAAAEGCDHVTLSPVFPTASKPGYGPALGLERLEEICRQAALPAVYALGGVVPGRAAGCIRVGARGVAVMGAVMGASDPARVTAALLRELSAT
ncbi:MAG: thiamine phosphate synthase [Candidatus Dormibacteria bacterium]